MLDCTDVCNNQIVEVPLHDRRLVLQVRVRKASTSCVSQAEGKSRSGVPDAEVDVGVHACDIVGPGDVTELTRFFKCLKKKFLNEKLSH